MFGFEPNQMCEVLQQGLQFWSKQRQNETIRYVQEIRKMKKHIEDSQLQNSDLSKVLIYIYRYEELSAK